MKTTWDELMRYAPEKEYPLPALERGEQERILNKTMKKLEKTKKRPARPVRTALLAAAIAALLCGTAFAAYTNGWFGFDRLFGEKTALIEGHIASYDETMDVDITQPTYTEEEQAMIDEGTMQVPDIADLSDTGVSAETDDFTFTLESMGSFPETRSMLSCASTRKTTTWRQSLPRSRKRTATRRSSSECCGSVRITTQTSAASARIIGWNGKTAA